MFRDQGLGLDIWPRADGYPKRPLYNSHVLRGTLITKVTVRSVVGSV